MLFKMLCVDIQQDNTDNTKSSMIGYLPNHALIQYQVSILKLFKVNYKVPYQLCVVNIRSIIKALL